MAASPASPAAASRSSARLSPLSRVEVSAFAKVLSHGKASILPFAQALYSEAGAGAGAGAEGEDEDEASLLGVEVHFATAERNKVRPARFGGCRIRKREEGLPLWLLRAVHKHPL